MTDIVVRSVDKKTYIAFKYEAQLRGLSRREALEQALKQWVENKPGENQGTEKGV